ncbi:hypothetical protein PEX1_048560 [Penicillium expansum]|uniref:Uncharacterized protein n=1 Tax=Penicillium expansum TaxID=27334 RepID=A0A0A2K812_PENEN|nr:hypothetical protein PEX2_043240 [Penicillium expansum]KGO43911.1 hypothetical protein PEXP_092410 [Penicillium expansum]KGO50942.1 hypothetical protein PEX1_048560 [Penicillium expansum]KGO63023.1 hypothetical protein PEX2_043240 [Penicillium expansum]
MMTTTTTTIFRTVVKEVSAASSPAPSATSTSSTPSNSSAAMSNLAMVPPGLWAVIIFVLCVAVGGIGWLCCNKQKKGDKPKEDEPREAEGTS